MLAIQKNGAAVNTAFHQTTTQHAVELTNPHLETLVAQRIDLAKALGLSLEVGDEYKIPSLMAPEWYDDFAWNPIEVEKPSRVLRVARPRRQAELVF